MVLSKGFVGFNQVNLSLEEKPRASNAQMEATKGVKKVAKKDGSQVRSELLAAWEKISALKGFIVVEWDATNVHQQKIAKLEEALEIDKVPLKATKEKAEAVEAWAIEEKSKAVTKAKSQAVEQFKAPTDFEAKVTNGCSMAYGYRFQACKMQVALLFSKVDMIHLDPEANDNEAEVEEDQAVLSSAVEAEVTPTTKVAPAPSSEPMVEEATQLYFCTFSISCNELFYQ